MSRWVQRAIPILVILALGGALVWDCTHRPDPAKQERERAQAHVEGIIGSIEYLKDSRTGLCFAHLWEGAGNGGPALATVPCDAVAKYLKGDAR